jgi:UPF0176 protein
MALLHNRIAGKFLKEQLRNSAQQRITLSFYKYHSLPDPKAFRDELYTAWRALEVWGRIYVATEGINAQLSLPADRFDDFKNHLSRIPFLSQVRLNTAIEDDGKSFFKLKIQVRQKIVADGIHDPAFDPADSGKHLSAAEYNQLSDHPGTIVVDMRNHYESEVGHFKNALCPDVDTFRESLPAIEKILSGKKDNAIVMYCTGGIRCEKASAWLKHRGFKKVFQLEGGIIEYARQVNALGLENKFVGKNFVFDERLGERISHDIISVCHQCGTPCDAHTNCRNEACHLLFIQCPACAEKFSGCCSTACQEIIALPLEQQQQLRKGKETGQRVFKKSRSGNIRFKSAR